MLQTLGLLLIAAAIFGVCRLVDVTFTNLFRSKAQHRSGLAIRANKRYGIFGVMLLVLGVLGITGGIGSDRVLLWGGVIVFLMGAGLAAHYLSFGIFYDGESFLVSRFGKKDREYYFRDIQEQKLYVVTGGNIIIELHMADGSAVSVQSNMDGVYPFMDTAFAAWCMQTGRKPEECSFYDPSNSWWFPHEEEA